MITGRADFNKYVSIESLEYGEEDGSGDAAFTISLKEYITISYSETKKKNIGREKSKKKSGKKRNSKSKKDYKIYRSIWRYIKKDCQRAKQENLPTLRRSMQRIKA